jgi:hypothetical protein
MDSGYYFKTTFLSITAGIFAGMFIYGLFDIDISNARAVGGVALRSFAVAVITGVLLGLANMYFKVDLAKKKNK